MTLENEFVKEDANDNPISNNTDHGIQLPFPALYVSWCNGDKNLKELGADNVKYCGGWKIDEKNLQTYREALGKPNWNLPLTWKPTTMSGDEGDYNVYLKKNIAISFVGIRERNIIREDGKTTVYPRFTKGTKSQMQMLCIMTAGDEIITVVLCAYSTTGGRIKDCIQKEYADATKELREKWGVPFYRMWIDLGVDKPDFIDPSFGKADKPRYIAPCKLLSYPTTEDDLKQTYIGKPVIAYTDELKIKAAEWMTDKRWLTGKSVDGIQAEATDEPDFMRD